jgi:Brp/Blh family beta-carotene 15,15'-monooxygenase
MLLLGCLLGIIAPEITKRFAAWPFVLALLIFGMPHGAADWVVQARLAGEKIFTRQLVGFADYLGLMFVCSLFLVWQPGVFALIFLGLTIFHFGMADATALRIDVDGSFARWSFVLGRGLLLLATVFAMQPVSAWAPFAQIAEAFAWKHETMWMPDLMHLQKLSWLGVIAGAGFAVAGAIARWRCGRARKAGLDLIEHALVGMLAVFADPLFAVGMFFLGVHAYRHTRRLACTRLVIEPPPAPAGFVRRLVRVHGISLPLMWPTALCLIPICWLLGPFNAHTLAVAGIVFYMITTLPHHLLGLRLPRPDLAPII